MPQEKATTTSSTIKPKRTMKSLRQKIANTDSSDNEGVKETVVTEPIVLEQQKSEYVIHSDENLETKKKSYFGVYALLFGLVVLAMIGAIGVSAAGQIGTNGPLASLGRVIPFENIPFFKTYVPDPSTVVAKSFFQNVGFSHLDRVKSLETKSEVVIDLEAENPRDRMPLNIDLSFKNDAEINSELQQKSTAIISGTVQSGAFKLDFGDPGITMKSIMPNTNTQYFSLDLSEELKGTVKPFFGYFMMGFNEGFKRNINPTTRMTPYSPGIAPEIDPDQYNVEDYLGKYYKFDVAEYMKFISDTRAQIAEEAMMQPQNGYIVPGSTPPSYVPPRQNLANVMNFQEFTGALKELLSAMESDLEKAYMETLGEMNEYSKVTQLPREQVNGKTALVYSVEVDNERVGEVMAKFIHKLPAVFKAHSADFKKYCERIMIEENDKAGCDQAKIEKGMSDFERALNSSDRLDSMVDNFFQKYITFKSFKVFVDPVDNSLLKYELVLDIHEDELTKAQNRARGTMSFSLKKFEVTVRSEEVSRGKELKIEEPSEYIDIIAQMRVFIDKMKKEALEDASQRGTTAPIRPIQPVRPIQPIQPIQPVRPIVPPPLLR